MAEWAIDSEAMKACFSNILLVGQKNLRKKYLSVVKAQLNCNPFLLPKQI